MIVSTTLPSMRKILEDFGCTQIACPTLAMDRKIDLSHQLRKKSFRKIFLTATSGGTLLFCQKGVTHIISPRPLFRQKTNQLLAPLRTGSTRIIPCRHLKNVKFQTPPLPFLSSWILQRSHQCLT